MHFENPTFALRTVGRPISTLARLVCAAALGFFITGCGDNKPAPLVPPDNIPTKSPLAGYESKSFTPKGNGPELQGKSKTAENK